MNKKILILTVMLLATLTLAIVPVQAAPKTEQTFTLYIEGTITDWGEGAHAGPRGTEAADLTKPDLIQRTFHNKATVFEISYADLTIDEVYRFGTPIGGEEKYTDSSKAKDTITFYDGEEVWGTLEISVREKMNFATMTPSSEGIIFGKGTGALKGVKIEGTTTGIYIPLGAFGGDPLPIITTLTRVGTITDWTPPTSP